MNTEITDNVKTNAWVLYDADCSVCVRTSRRFKRVLARRGFELLPLQSRTGVSPAQPSIHHAGNEKTPHHASPGTDRRDACPTFDLTEMRVLLADGKILGGADAVVYLARRIWWLWPLWAVSLVPGAMPLLRRGYRWFAANRYCIGGKCEVRSHKRHHRTRTFFEMP